METSQACTINQPRFTGSERGNIDLWSVRPAELHAAELSDSGLQTGWPHRAASLCSVGSRLRRKMKRALVQTGVASHFAPHARTQHGFEHVLLEPSNDRVMLHQIQDRGMTLEDTGAAVFAVKELGHVAFAITKMREPLRAFCYRVSLCLGFKRRGFLFENAVKKLLRSVWSVDFLGRFQEIESKLMTVGLKKIVAPTRKAIDHLRASHFLRAPPRVKVAVAVKGDAMLLNAHVTHVHSFHELVDGHSPGALE